MINTPSPTFDKSLLAVLSKIVGSEHLLTAPEDLLCYGYDATPSPHRPQAVVRPGSATEMAAILRLANEAGFPVVPRGSGTNLSGGTVPIRGGLVVQMGRFDHILEIDEENLTATAGPGVILGDFHRAVEAKGLFYPPDPASLAVASLGGTVGEGAGGPRGFKYGTTRDYILGLETVLPGGEVVRLGGKTVKNQAGYDLVHLMVGSEGTLGVVTEITVRLLPLPPAKRTCLAIFATLEAAAEAVSAMIRARTVPTTLELLDDVSMRYVEAFRPTGVPLGGEATLLIEVDGVEAEVAQGLDEVTRACHRFGAQEVRLAQTPAEAEALWAARRAAFPAMARARPTTIIEDVTVPRPAVPRLVRAIREAARRHQVEVGIFGHLGDGNTHPQIMCDAADPEEWKRVEAFSADIFEATLKLGGTLTGEHGIGLLKRPFLGQQLGRSGLELERRIKAAWDPKGIMNPGKVFPDDPLT